jgi:hypothetical protein
LHTRLNKIVFVVIQLSYNNYHCHRYNNN